MTRHYVLDFDGTLFDTEMFWKWIVERFTREGLEREVVRDLGEQLFPLKYTVEKHARGLGLVEETVRSIVEEFDEVTRSTSPSLVYPDVLSFLNGRPSTILTHGEEAFQKFKIASAGLDGRIGGVRIAGPEYRKVKHLEEMLAMSETPHLFVDDNPKELLRVHEAGLPVELVRMRREGQRHAKDDHELDDQVWRVIRSLNELE